ncbi:MAG: hypothetical protein ABSB38_00835 [Dehalococcoidia bacterium]
MNKAVIVAVAAAVNAYMEQEEPAKAFLSRVMPLPEISAWRVFGRQELIRARSRWQASRRNR